MSCSCILSFPCYFYPLFPCNCPQNFNPSAYCFCYKTSVLLSLLGTSIYFCPIPHKIKINTSYNASRILQLSLDCVDCWTCASAAQTVLIWFGSSSREGNIYFSNLKLSALWFASLPRRKGLPYSWSKCYDLIFCAKFMLYFPETQSIAIHPLFRCKQLDLAETSDK